MKTICRIVAGSRLYGLETADSDFDTRGVFLNDNHAEILGLSRKDVIKSETEDTLLLEFRHYMGHLRSTNTSAIELLFAEGFDILTEEFKTVRENKFRLLDSEKLFVSLMGYIEGERRLANGERSGQLGSKRKAQIDIYGFSPKNFSHLLRLAYCGEMFFRESIYPVCLKGHPAWELIFSVKAEPEKHSRDKLNLLSDEFVGRLKDAYEKRKDNLRFDLKFANQLCFDFYMPLLTRSDS